MLGKHIGQVLSLGLLFASSAFASLAGVAESVHQLNEDNFEAKVSKGLWLVLLRWSQTSFLDLILFILYRLVEHFSPGCKSAPHIGWQDAKPSTRFFRWTLPSFRSDL